MTYEEVLTKIADLSPKEKRRLIAHLNLLIQQELQLEYPLKGSAKRVRGMLRTEGELPSDEELKEDYINYLEEKYS